VDVTASISGNGNYLISGFPTNPPTPQKDTDGASLLIIYSDPTAAYEGHMVINDGCCIQIGGTNTQTMSGINACANSTFGRAFALFGDLQPAFSTGGSQTLANTPNPGYTMSMFDWQEVACNVTAGQNTATYSHFGPSDCFNFMMMGLYYRTTTCTTCPQSSALTLTPSTTQPSCNICNGSAGVTVTGGTGPYTYSWVPGNATTSSISNLCPGTYTVYVTDATCLQSSTTITLNSVNAVINTSTSFTNPLCFGDCNGTGTVTPTGGSAPYTYSWYTTPSQSTQTASGLCAGTYSVLVTDANGCTAVASVTLTDPPALTLQATGFAETCQGACDGQVVCIPGGGTGTYTYSWSNGCTTPGCLPLCTGTYTITVTDANGCTIQDTAIVSSPPGLTLQMSSTPSLCGQPNGSATVVASGGTGTYTYAWSPSGGSNATANNLSGGTYTVIVTDGNGCSATATVVVASPSAVTAAISASTNISCFGMCNGTATVTASSGVQPYTYSWNSTPAQSTATAAGLCSGSYTVTVTDSNNCTATATVMITQPTQLTVTASQSQSICSGASATVSGLAQGGTPAYTYAWAPTGSGTSFTASPAATTTYTLTVTDANGCTDSTTTTVTVNPLPVFSISADDSDGCVTHCVNFSSSLTNGASYNWNFGDGANGTGTGSGHCYTVPGTYSVTLTLADANGCSSTVTVNGMINVYPMPVAGFGMSTESTTILEPTVAFTNTSVGASTYSWDFGDPGSGANNSSVLPNPSHTFSDTGTFCITLWVESANGCRDSISYCLTITPDFTFYAPNAITPDGDGINDGFLPKGTGWDPASFKMYIFDRWGNLIFETSNMNQHWDGRVQGKPEIVQEDVYVWKVVLKDFNGGMHQYVGHVSVIK